MSEIKFRIRYIEGIKTTFEQFCNTELVKGELKTITVTFEQLIFMDFVVKKSIITRDEYTGLKDKNGVEIYENDIIKLNYAKGVDFICEIKYEKAGFLLGCEKFRDSYEWLSEHSNCENWCDYIEVIGNIYENEDCRL